MPLYIFEILIYNSSKESKMRKRIPAVILLCLCVFLGGVFAEESAVTKKHLQTLQNMGESSNLRTASLNILVKAKEKSVVPILISIAINKTEDAKLRVLAMKALSEIKPEGCDALINNTMDFFAKCLMPWTGERRDAGWKTFDEKELPFVIEYMHALGNTKREEVLDLMSIPVNVKATRVIIPSVMADLGKPGLSFVLSMCEDNDVKTRKNAVIGLGKIGDKTSVTALIEVMKEDGNVGVRMEAVKSLAIVGDKNDKKSIPALEEKLKAAFLDEEKKNIGLTIKLIKSKKSPLE